MDLIGALAGQLGIDDTQAEAVAGAVLGSVKTDAPEEETEAIDEAIPELEEWEATAKEALATDSVPAAGEDGLSSLVGSGLGNDLLGAVAGAETAEKAAAVALLDKLGLEPAHAALAAPVLLQFLEDRVGEEAVDTLLAAAPLLAGLQQAAGDGEGAGLGTGLGGLFG